MMTIKPTVAGLDLMKRMGGSFCTHLAQTWMYADEHNRRKLEMTFESYFKGYNDNAAFIERNKNAK